METTRTILVTLMDTLKEQFAAELDRLPMQKKVREVLKAGFADGVRSGVFNTCKMLEVTIKEE